MPVKNEIGRWIFACIVALPCLALLCFDVSCLKPRLVLACFALSCLVFSSR
jgi:hypothetical protein